jgi:hypothetical protein
VVVDIKGDIRPGIPILLVNAALDIRFSGMNSIFFNACGCSVASISDKDKVFSKLLDQYYKGQWKKENKLITDVINADSTTVIISSASNAAISLEAENSDIKVIDITQASMGLKASSERNIGLSILTKGGLTPLIKLSGMFSIWPLQTPRMDQMHADSNDPETIIFQTLD